MNAARSSSKSDAGIEMAPLVLVTGASSGIGRAFAERLGNAGFDLIIVGRRRDRLDSVAASLPDRDVTVVVADLATQGGIDHVTEIVATHPLTMLINNAGVSHYMPLHLLPAQKARELTTVKVTAPTLLTRAALPHMLASGTGTIINIAGMLAFAGPAPAAPAAAQRATYTGTLAYTVAMTQTLNAELHATGVTAHVVCPGIVATEFHEVQGMDMSAVPRMSADDVVTAALRGVDLGETVIAPGLTTTSLLERVFEAELAAFAGQSPTLASRYRD
jgi:uncharacterized protein